MKTLKKIQTALSGEDGASNVEIIVWISVVMVIATVLFAFRTQIVGFVTKAGGQVDSLKVK